LKINFVLPGNNHNLISDEEFAILASHRGSNEFETSLKSAMKDPHKFQQELPFREGADAIYVEPHFIAYVRVSDVRSDDWGINAFITVLHTPGMRDEGEPSYEISAAWDIFSNYYDHWHATYVNWSVYFGAEEVKAGLDAAARAAKRGSRVELREMRSTLEKIQRERRGPVIVKPGPFT